MLVCMGESGKEGRGKEGRGKKGRRKEEGREREGRGNTCIGQRGRVVPR